MRTHLLYLLCCLLLSNCASYGNIHSQSQPLTVSTLSTPHSYQPTTAQKTEGWWRKFHDAQLNQLIDVALSDSPTLQMAEARIRRADQLTEETASTLWPSVDFSGYVERERFSNRGLVPPPFNGHTYNIGSFGLNFNYEFDFWGKHRQELAARINEECAAKAELAEARLVLTAAIAHTYFQLREDIAQVQNAKETWQLRNQLLQIAKTRTKHGINSEIPVKTLETNAEIAKLNLEQYRQRELLSQHLLAVLMGKNPLNTKITTAKWAFHSYKIALPASLPANLLANRPDITAAKLHAESAANRINVAKTYFFPNINLSALFSYQSVGLGHLFEPSSQNNAIAGAIDLPLFDAGARRANLGVKYADYDHAVNLYNQTILTALQEVADQLSILKTVKSQLATETLAFQSAERRYKLYQSRYNHGIADYTEVLASKEEFLQQRSTQLTLQARHLQAVVGTLKALGGNDFIGQG